MHFRNCLSSSIYNWSEQMLTWIIKCALSLVEENICLSMRSLVSQEL